MQGHFPLISFSSLLGLQIWVCSAAIGDPLPKFPPPAYCLGDNTQGLRQSAGALFFDNVPLKLDQAPGSCFGAAYYPLAGVLVIVENNGTTLLFQGNNHTLKAKNVWNAEENVRTNGIRFGRVPGLLYIHGTNLDVAAFLEKVPDQQTSAKRLFRVTLTEESTEWHAIDVGELKGVVIEGCYRKTVSGVQLSLAEAQWVNLELPEPLESSVAVSTEPPGVMQSIFIFPGRAVVSRTRSGWAINAPDGTLRKTFSSPEGDGWWHPPKLENNQFVAFRSLGPGGDLFRFDESAGKLVLIKHY
jgi:hypothetical protein